MPLNKFDKNTDRILFISPGYADGSQNEKETCFIQLGLLYLGTVLKENGYSVKFLFSDYPDIDEIKEKIEREKIVLTGFYTTTENISRCIKCAGIFKKSFPDLLIIMGGPHVSVVDSEILKKESIIDLIVRKEGENTILELAKFYFDGLGSLEDIKGITYRKNNEIIKNPDMPYIDNLDILPIPDRDLLDEPIRYFDRLYPRIITGRGCPFKCAFCYEGMGGNKYRMRSAENVLSEVDYLINRGEVKYIRFLDDTFTVNPSRTMKICKGLRERSEEGKKFVWFAEGRVDVLTRHPRLIYEMSLAGLVNLQMGVECADQKILDLYQKNITIEEIENVVKISAEALIPAISINFILGGPFESGETYKKNLEFIKKLMTIAPGRLNVTSSLLVPFPGTEIRKNPKKFGLKIIDEDCTTGMTNETCFCETEYMNKYELTNLKRNFDRDVQKIMIDISKNLSPDIISQQFFLRFYGITSPWYSLLSTDIGIRRFFNLRLHGANLILSEIPEKDLLDYYPTRTYPINYNNENLIIFKKIRGIEILDFTESQLYELSSGKRTLREIISLGKERIFKGLTDREVYEKVINFYSHMEKYYAIIFAKI